MNTQHTTIEHTSKPIKLVMVGSVAGWIASMVMFAVALSMSDADEQAAAALSAMSIMLWMASAAVCVGAIVYRWWHHG